jgi:hypothetical protein
MNRYAFFGCLTGLLFLVAFGCASPQVHSIAPDTAVSQALHYIDSGYAHDAGSFSRDGLRLSSIRYSYEDASVEVSFFLVASYHTNSDGAFTSKALDIDMDKAGRFLSASMADFSTSPTNLPVGF